ncbi:hypothetical protein ID866_1901 [Astraeus odoratus]|nr:hypothetical protein ID866_1901 [Astraeus odoratus]
MSDDEHSESELPLQNMFTEQPRPPTPKATFVSYTRQRRDEGHPGDGPLMWDLPAEVSIRLVGSHPLWGHHL